MNKWVVIHRKGYVLVRLPYHAADFYHHSTWAIMIRLGYTCVQIEE